MLALEVSHLKKSYGNVIAVDDLSFDVRQGEVFGLVGPNGAGKTTTMLMINGLLPPDSGKILLAGQPFDPRNRQIRLKLGLAPQDLALYPDLTAAQNLRFFARLYGLRGRHLQQRIDDILGLTGLQENADHRMSSFSGGMKRRLNFGVALLHEPEFVVLDEPTVGIDPQSRSHLLDGVRELSRKGVAVLYASHYMEEIEAVCQRVAIVDHGRLLQQGALEELLGRRGMNVSIKVPHVTPELTAKLRGIAQLRVEPDGSLSLSIEDGHSNLNTTQTTQLRQVLDLLDDARIPLTAIETQAASLEKLFLQLTGRSLRD